MTLLFIDGFSHYDTAGLTLKGWVPTVAASGTMTVEAGAGRFGGGALVYRSTAATSNTARVTRTFPASATWVIGFYAKLSHPAISTAPYLVRLLDSGTMQLELRLDSTGKLVVTHGGTVYAGMTSTVPLVAGQWHYIEWRVTISNAAPAGSCAVRQDGAQVIANTGTFDAQETLNASANHLDLGTAIAVNVSGVSVHYSDLYVANKSGAVNNDFLGERRVVTILPAGPGANSQWTPTAGANWQCVDDNPPNLDTDYVWGDTMGQTDTYAMATLPVAPVLVSAVQTTLTITKGETGTTNHAEIVRSGGTDYAGASTVTPNSWGMFSTVHENDPATAAPWTAAGINAAEFGVRHV